VLKLANRMCDGATTVSEVATSLVKERIRTLLGKRGKMYLELRNMCTIDDLTSYIALQDYRSIEGEFSQDETRTR